MMDRNEKRRFIEDLCADVRDELVKKIPQMPEEWDGLELRELLTQKFADSCLMTRGPDSRRRFRTRLRDYRNEVIVRNL